jgi:hypothetical protein
VSVSQQACNIAYYLTQSMLKASINQVVNDVTAGRTMATSVAAIVALIPGVDLTIGLIVGAGAILVNIISTGTLSDYSGALADGTLWARVECAIYLAIVADGQVTPGNFAALVAAVGAVSYAHADVIASMVSYLNAGGVNVLLAAQNLGSTYVGDCSACAPWCWRLDFTAAALPWHLGGGPDGVYVAGVGYQGTTDAGGYVKQELDMYTTFAAAHVESIEIEFLRTSADTHANSYFQVYLASGFLQLYAIPGTANAAPQTVTIPIVQASIDQINLRMSADGGTAGSLIVTAVRYRGHGAVNPFGASNCV